MESKHLSSKVEGSVDLILFFDRGCRNVENPSLDVILQSTNDDRRGDVVMMPRRFVAGHVASEERFRPEFMMKSTLPPLCLAIPPPFHRTNDLTENKSRFNLTLASDSISISDSLKGVSFAQQIVETCHDYGVPLKLALPHLLRERQSSLSLKHLLRAEIVCRSASKVLDNILRERKDVIVFANSFLLGFSCASLRTIMTSKDATSFSRTCLSKAFGEKEGEMLYEFWCVKLRVELLMGTFGMTGKLRFTSEEKHHLRSLACSLRRDQVLEALFRCCSDIVLRPSSIRRLWENDSIILEDSDFVNVETHTSRSKDMNIRIRHVMKKCSSLVIGLKNSKEKNGKETMERMLSQVFGDDDVDDVAEKRTTKTRNEFALAIDVEKLDNALRVQDLSAAREVVSRYSDDTPIIFEIVVCVLEIISCGPTKQKLEYVLSRLQDLIVSPVPRLQPKMKCVNLSVGEARNDVMRGAHNLTIELLKFAAPESIDEFDELLDEILAVTGNHCDDDKKKIDIIDSTRNLLRYSRWISTDRSVLIRRSFSSILKALPPDRGQLYVQGSVAGLSLEEEQRMIEQQSGHKEEDKEKAHRFMICEPTFGVSGMLASKVVCGYRHVAVIDAFKRLWTFGHGECGRLGHGNELSIERPKLVKALAEHSVEDVACGREHTIAVSNTGLYTWGWGEAGRLGLNDESTRMVPTKVPIRRNDVHGGVLKVAAGREHSFCITANGFLYVSVLLFTPSIFFCCL